MRVEVTFLPDGSAQVDVDTSMVLHTNGRMTVELSLPEDHFRVAQRRLANLPRRNVSRNAQGNLYLAI